MQRLITIVGGSGFLGAALVERLARAGWRILVACRQPQRPGAQRLRTLGDVGQISFARADIRVPATLAAAVQGADTVVNLVGILDEKSGQRFAQTQAEGPGAIARAVAGAGVSRFVHVSAIGADPSSPSAYGRTKGEGEAAARAAFPATTILRPSLVFGPEDGFTNRFARLIRLGPVVPVIAPETKFQPVFVGDVAAAIEAAIDRPGETFSLGGPDVMSMREIMAFIAAETGVDRPLVDMPDVAARAMAAFGSLPGMPMTKDQYLMLQRDNVVPPGEAGLEALGITPASLASRAPAWLQRYRDGGRFVQRPAG